MLVNGKNHIGGDIYYTVYFILILTFRIQIRFFHIFFNGSINKLVFILKYKQ